MADIGTPITQLEINVESEANPCFPIPLMIFIDTPNTLYEKATSKKRGNTSSITLRMSSFEVIALKNGALKMISIISIKLPQHNPIAIVALEYILALAVLPSP
eukprot:CAMPEP_0202972634 /NCGR_PEP_ID=MMETSP1396-20130829/38359_1 /ASSEMBLY_ACC=CAM_ASM_000872 /TAXON_ID= /ORGANISM="Pseudokeronopsis sp., Strain Brazil" /LENGTH=102 /DNA_ID=CAMNT_0049703261 /DNA_START=45 /DNA_END=349 /DNA_ORIENTATION=+